ncbi:MAG TPA: PASTA domain-containing protein, partial [Ignavibacteriaceae bacterium]
NVVEKIIEHNPGLVKPVNKDNYNEDLKIAASDNSADDNVVYTNASYHSPDPELISVCIAKNMMPDLSNYHLKDAISVLSKLGIGYKMNGTGMVVSQSIIPGTRLRKGQICKLECKEIPVNGTAVY